MPERSPDKRAAPTPQRPEGSPEDAVVHRQSALLRLSTGIAAAHDEAEICRSIVRGLHDESIGYDFVAVFLVDSETGDRVMQAGVGWSDVPDDMRLSPGQGLSARPLDDGVVHYTPDVTSIPEYVPGLTSGSEVDVPISIDGSPVGVIVVESEHPHAFGSDDLEILTAAANQAGIAIGRVRLAESLREHLAVERRRAEEQHALIETMRDLSSELEVSRLLQSVLVRAVRLLEVSAGELAIFDDRTNELEIVANHNTGTVSTGTRLQVGEGAMGHVAESREPLVIPDYQEWAGRSAKYANVEAHAVLVVPLLIGDRLVGTLSVWDEDRSRQFGPPELRLVNMFAPHASVAIENARLFGAARRQKHYFEELVRNSPVAIVTLDVDHNLVSCNPAFETLYGYNESEVVGRNLDDVIAAEGSRSQAVGFTKEAERNSVQGIGQRRRKDGSLVDVEVLAVPVIVDGERVGMMGLYHDVTELLRTRRMAEAASSAKSTFLANMSHELRTPLNAIIGYSEMLLEDAEEMGNSASLPDLTRIHDAGKHLLGLINDVLDLSKIEAGKMELYVESADIRSILEQVATTVRPLVEKNGNTLSIECAEELGTLHTDVTRLRQVLLNLLSNASKFTENGTITLSATLDPHESGGADWLQVSVTDTGIGMTEEQLGKLFEAFSQADASTASSFGGTGLGLAISKRFCEMMGGTLSVTSAPNVGSTFAMRIPTAIGDAGKSAPRDSDEGGEATESVSGERGTVLVIDDDEAARGLMRRYLVKEGFRILEAPDGKTGLELAEEARPDVITLDVLMPGMDGWTVLTSLKESPTLRDIPVIMVTITDERNLGSALGASDYMTKPVDRDHLAAILKRYAAGEDDRSVLIVEDDEGTRRILRRTIENEGWDVVEAANGRVALTRVAERRPSVILLDLIMPEMDGFEFLDQLRTTKDGQTIPVVVITAKELTDEDRQRLNGGVERVFHKGGQARDELLAEICDLVGVHAASR